jgi:PEP-CTERM motif
MRKRNLVAVAFASITTAVFAGAIGVVATATEASAQLAPSSVANEVMMEDAAAENVILGSMATPTSGQSLSYTSSVDPTTNDYTFSTTAGQSLNGNSVSLTGSGTETLSSAGFPSSLLTPCSTYTCYYWTTTDSFAVGTGSTPGTPVPSTDYEVAYYDPVTMHWYIASVFYWDDMDLEIYVVTNKDVTVDADYGYFTDSMGNMIPGTAFYSASVYNPDTEDWDIEIWPEYPYPGRPYPSEPGPEYLSGVSTPGYPGTFTATFVPEPSTWAMMLIGFAGLGYLGYRSRKRSAALAA